MALMCSNCQMEFRPSRNGVIVVRMSSTVPLSLHMADEWECKGTCGAKVIHGFGTKAYSNHYEEGFQERFELEKARDLKRSHPLLRYNYP